jgi:tRNA A37 methylthiotransferase MiaB
MLRDISASYSLSPSLGYAMSISGGGRTSIPVSPSNYIYSHFRHVSGTPAPEGMQGVSISKLKVLDVMIERLSKMKQQPKTDMPQDNQQMSDKQIDALIETYKNEMKQAQVASTAMPYKPSPDISTGLLFNIAIS